MYVTKIVSMAVLLAGLSQASVVYAATVSGSLPEWVTDQSASGQCVVGVADKEAGVVAKEAMSAALLELGMMRIVKVDSLNKMYSEKTVIKDEQLSSQVVRLLAQTSDKKVVETKKWQMPSGDYFAQVCVDDKGAQLRPVVGILKTFVEENKINSSAVVKRSLDLSIGSKTRVKDSVQFNYVGTKNRMSSQVHDESLQFVTIPDNENDIFTNAVVSEVAVRDAKIAQAYLQALALARGKLANKFSDKISVVVQGGVDQLPSENVSKKVASEVLKNTTVVKVRLDKIDNMLYMIMKHEFTGEDIKKVVERNIKNKSLNRQAKVE